MKQTTESLWLDICDAEQIPLLGSRIVRAPSGDIAIFRTAGDQFFAVRDRCPHKGGALSEGIVHGNRVTCPLHNWVIDLTSGEARAPDIGCVKRFPVERRGQRLWLSLVPESAIAAQVAG